MRKRTKVVIAVASVAIILVAAACIGFYAKFGTANGIAVLYGYMQVTQTNADAYSLRDEPEIHIAKPGIALLDRHMESRGYAREDDAQMGSIYVYTNGEQTIHIDYAQNKYYSLWKWIE